MDYFANVDGVSWFAREVFPKLRERFEGLEFVIVGRSPSTKVLELEELPGVAVTGAVADVRPFLARATAFVAPLRIARGVQNKVLEAMASDLPVVCTREVGAGLAGGGFESGRDLIIAQGKEDFAAGLGRLLESGELRRRLRASARKRVSEAYSLEATMLDFERFLVAAATGKLPLERDSSRRASERIA
jgi:glycosyltransferase involved in cell wall biosynthesis